MPKYASDAEDAAHGISVEASIWSDDATWFDGIEKETEVVILGIWDAKTGKRSPSKEPAKYPFSEFTARKLNLTLSLQAQIAKVPNSR
jgi:hypothetical protein